MIFTVEDLVEDNIYFLDRETNFLFLFSSTEKGFITTEENDSFKFKWVINKDGLLKISIKGNDEIWKLKEINEKEKFIVVEKIKKENKKISRKEAIIDFEYNNKKTNDGFLFLFSLFNKKQKTYFLSFFLLCFLVLFTLFSFTFLTNQFNFLLKSFLCVIILIIGKDYLSYLFVKYFKKYIKE